MDVASVRPSLRAKVFPLVALFVLFIASANAILAQSTASLGGTVTDVFRKLASADLGALLRKLQCSLSRGALRENRAACFVT